MTLTLPEPPSPNAHSTNGQASHREKRRYQRLAWATACSQAIPPAEPPNPVRITAHFRLHQLRDEDNLQASLKWLLDSLRQEQADRKWRRGIFEDRGFFTDDNPACLTIEAVTQEVDRSNRGVDLEITPARSA